MKYLFFAASLLQQLFAANCWGITPILPTHLVVVSYGRKAGDPATENVEHVLKVFKQYCPFLPSVHFVDDLSAEAIQKEKGKYPGGAFVLINAHGTVDETGVLKIGTQVKINEFAAGEPIVNAASELSHGSKSWLGLCHAGAATFKKGAVVGAECSAKELASANLNSLKKLIPLYCSAQGADGCVLFNKWDRDHDGKLEPQEIKDYLLQKRTEKRTLLASSSEQLEEKTKECAKLYKGSVRKITTLINLNAKYTQKGKDAESDVDEYLLLKPDDQVFNPELSQRSINVDEPYKRRWNIGSCRAERNIGVDEAKTLALEAIKKFIPTWPERCDLLKMPGSIALIDGTPCETNEFITKRNEKFESQNNVDCSLESTIHHDLECEFEEDGIATGLDDYTGSAFNHPDPKTFSLENEFCLGKLPADRKPKQRVHIEN